MIASATCSTPGAASILGLELYLKKVRLKEEMLIVSCRVHFETRVGLMREVQAVVSRAGKRNSPHKIIREKEDDNKHWANVGLIGGIRKASFLV